MPTRARALGRLRFGPGDPTTAIADGRWWWSAHTIHGPATIAITLAEEGPAQVWGAGADCLLARANALTGADDDPSSFRAVHPALVAAVRRRGVPRLGATGSVFTALVQAVLGQRVTTVEALRSWAAIVRAFGTPAPGPENGLMTAPSAERLAALPYYALHPHGVERGRASTIIRIARVAGRVDALATGGTLEALPGVGPWSAAHVRAVALGDVDAVAVGDLHLPDVVAWVLADERHGDDVRMLELLAPYAGHRARVIRLLLEAGLGPPRRAPHRRLEPNARR